MTDAQIHMYGLTKCSTCVKARQWLQERGVPAVFTDYREHPLPAGDLARAPMHVGIGGSHDWTFHRARHDLACAVLGCRVVENLVAQQRPVLHQSEHCIPP